MKKSCGVVPNTGDRDEKQKEEEEYHRFVWLKKRR